MQPPFTASCRKNGRDRIMIRQIIILAVFLHAVTVGQHPVTLRGVDVAVQNMVDKRSRRTVVMESRGLIHRAERLAGPGQVAGQRGHRSIGIGHIQISGNECRQIVGAVFFQPGDDQFRRIAPRGRRLVIEMRIQIENFFAGIRSRSFTQVAIRL